MDAFSYLSVLLSIIVGLAITQLLKGYRGLVLGDERVQRYWPTIVWSASLLLMNVQSWWAMFDLREVRVWTFAAFATVLAQTIVQYLLAAIVFPDFFGSERVDLRAHYWAHVRSFFGLLILLLLASLSKDVVFTGHLTGPVNLAFHVGFITVAAASLLIRNEAFHKAVAIGIATLFAAYVVVLFARLH